MNRLLWLCLLALLLAMFPAVVVAGQAEPDTSVSTPLVEDEFAGNACVQCHRDLPGRSSEIVELEWKQSVHFNAKVGCDGCHGGNASLKPDALPSSARSMISPCPCFPFIAAFICSCIKNQVIQRLNILSLWIT